MLPAIRKRPPRLVGGRKGKERPYSVELPLLSISGAQLDEVASESESCSEMGGDGVRTSPSGAETPRKSIVGHKVRCLHDPENEKTLYSFR